MGVEQVHSLVFTIVRVTAIPLEAENFHWSLSSVILLNLNSTNEISKISQIEIQKSN